MDKSCISQEVDPEEREPNSHNERCHSLAEHARYIKFSLNGVKLTDSYSYAQLKVLQIDPEVEDVEQHQPCSCESSKSPRHEHQSSNKKNRRYQIRRVKFQNPWVGSDGAYESDYAQIQGQQNNYGSHNISQGYVIPASTGRSHHPSRFLQALA